MHGHMNVKNYKNILHGKMTLQWNSEENAVKKQTGFIWLRLGTVGDIIWTRK